MEVTNPMEHWQEPQRQSPAAIFILLWTTAFDMLKGFWPILVLYFFRNERNDSLMLIWGFVGFSILTIGGATISYWFKKFHITKDTLVIQSGWLRKKTLSIPVHTIQAVHLEQNVWQQAFNVARVSFDSVGSDDVEAKLDALATGKAEQLRNLLMEKKEKTLPEVGDVKQEDTRPTYSLTFSDLMKLSLTANHLEAFFILLALLLNVMDELRQIFGGDDDYLNAYGKELFGQTATFFSMVMIAVIVLSMLFSIARTMVKYYGFRLKDADRRWMMSYGLFEKTKKIVPINKIQVLSWKANWLRRKIDYWTVHVQSVGHKENRKTNIHIPVVSFERVIQLVSSYQSFVGIHVEGSFKLEPAYWKRSASRTAVLITLIPLFGFYFWIGAQAFWVLLIYPFLVWYEYRWYQNFRWQTNETGLQTVSGVFGRKFTLLNWGKIQQVHLHQNIYQRRRRLATVIFVTAGGRVHLPYIRITTATTLVNQVLYEVESNEGGWM